MSRRVWDASVVLAFLADEPLSVDVLQYWPDGFISAVNLAEVVGKLADRGMPEAAVRALLVGIPLEVVPFDASDALEVGLLRPATRSRGLSLGDRACLGLARRLGLPALTTDRCWAELTFAVEIVR